MKKQYKYIWLMGLLGFQDFTYFITHKPLSLFWFSFFGFFAFYFVNKLSKEMPDERYFENSKNAQLKTSGIPLITLFLVGFAAGFPFVTKEIIILVCALGYAATLISYAVLFWYNDTH